MVNRILELHARVNRLLYDMNSTDRKEMLNSRRILVVTRALVNPITIGLAIRLGLAWLLPWLLDDGQLVPGVAYTDIDYHVFMDAAAHVRRGGSPYQRTTYRYTPLLAVALAHLGSRNSARYLFCLADTLCGAMIWQACRIQRKQQVQPQQPPPWPQSQRPQQPPQLPQSQSNTLGTSTSVQSLWMALYIWYTKQEDFQDALWWLYNPLAINICTRGSAESLLVLLPVLCTLWCCTTRFWDISSFAWPWWIRPLTTGVAHGVAIHSKIYPIIYTLSLATALQQIHSIKISPSIQNNKTPHTFLQWIRNFLQPSPFLFGIVTMMTFGGLTFLAVHWYGPQALQEGLLYHVSRVDHRHNYSIHWYWIYLARANPAVDTSLMAWFGRALLLPQAAVLIVSSWKMASPLADRLALCLFFQTLLFVLQNKVITAQYFTWYLCLLPLCASALEANRRPVGYAVAWLLVSIVTWLASAYMLEMQGAAVHGVVWIASLHFYLAHVNLMRTLLASVKPLPTRTTTATTTAAIENQKNKAD